MTEASTVRERELKPPLSASKMMRAVAKLADYLGEGRNDHASNTIGNQNSASLLTPYDRGGRRTRPQPERSAEDEPPLSIATAKPSFEEDVEKKKGRRADHRVALFFNEEMLRHTHDWPHIEKAERLRLAFDQLKKHGIAARCSLRPGRAATDVELLSAHTARHLEEVRNLTARVIADPMNRNLREPDGPGGIFYSPAAEQAARLACGCVIEATYTVLDASPQKTRSRRVEHDPDPHRGSAVRPSYDAAFALVRPPGHHAGHDDTDGHRAEGFCFFNSAAVAARCALETRRAKRVAIIDWDIHHGNGTQTILYEDPRVLYISLHRWAAPCPLTTPHRQSGSVIQERYLI